MARTKTNTRNDTKHVEHHDATDIKNILCVFFESNNVHIKTYFKWTLFGSNIHNRQHFNH